MLTRYGHNIYAGTHCKIEEDDNGRLCLYADAAALEAERDQLQARLAALDGQRCETCANVTADDEGGLCCPNVVTGEDQYTTADHGCRAWQPKAPAP